MTHMTADAAHAGHAVPGRVNYPQLRDANITLPVGAGKGKAMALLVVGILGLVAVVAGGFLGTGEDAHLQTIHAIAAYHFAVMSALAMTLGCLFFALVFQLTNAGWTGTIRRQYENVATLVPILGVMALVGIAVDTIIGRGHSTQLFIWLHPSMHDNVVLSHKTAYLNPIFFMIRAALYLVIWTYLARRLYALSVEQDRTGDRWLTAKARSMAAWGILVFALSTSFAGFDWLMSIDFGFFSTMWGVYFFAGAAYSSSALMLLIFARLVKIGKLQGVVTREHFHDMGKLLFAFTVFWAYIAFSQYFLIWYSNIPEETAFINARVEGGWLWVSGALCVLHFGLPFLILLFRGVKQNPTAISLVAILSLAAHALDHFWITRPAVYSRLGGADTIGIGTVWIDIAAVIGVTGIVGFLIVRKVCAGTLVAVNDPRMDEAMTHRNYV